MDTVSKTKKLLERLETSGVVLKGITTGMVQSSLAAIALSACIKYTEPTEIDALADQIIEKLKQYQEPYEAILDVAMKFKK